MSNLKRVETIMCEEMNPEANGDCNEQKNLTENDQELPQIRVELHFNTNFANPALALFTNVLPCTGRTHAHVPNGTFSDSLMS